jgi:hypothetical protein
MVEADDAPFRGKNRRVIGDEIVHLVRDWREKTARGGSKVLGNEPGADQALNILEKLQREGLVGDLRAIEQLIRDIRRP